MANEEYSCFCQAFSPSGSRISLRSLPPKKPFHEEATIRRESAKSRVDDWSEVSYLSSRNSGADALRHSIQSTLSEIESFSRNNGVTFVSHEDSILNDIHQQQIVDAQTMASTLPPEDDHEARLSSTTTNQDSSSIPSYQWLHTERAHKPLAIQTKQPILDDTTIAWIRGQAHSIWNDASKTVESRFTYQRKGNYEVHLSDLIEQGSNVNARREIRQALQQKIYPLVREAFGTSLADDPCSLQFCVYDAIVIRYNATEAGLCENTIESVTFETKLGAGQPLHRDLGLVSVNVMLNSPNEFEGGGTFMEDQLQDLLWESSTRKDEEVDQNSLPLPLKPMGGPGHALLHLSSDRHAGASTRRGVRDILVFFLTASKTATDLDKDQYSTPLLEQAARLKSTARAQCEKCLVKSISFDESCKSAIWQPLASAICRAKYQHLAIQAIPTDGEAWQYLGMALCDIQQTLGMFIMAKEQSGLELVSGLDVVLEYQQRLVQLSISILEMAKQFTPCDARVWHNLAWVLDQTTGLTNKPEIDHEIQSNYSRAMELHQAFQQAGCDVGIDYDSTILNYGLYLANEDHFSKAVKVLELIRPSALQVQQQMMEQKSQTQQEQKLQQRFGLIQDAQRLLSYCQRQLS
ncbi:unnamed protein product [Cylindrotheca closterium]|uniref:Fe2OG dioxygenase domain-containing protein n=1 Tax=Cylindrotheca closterium TaxID=2856 RepID=A0AAD2FMX2_9STRA|nr:unnamed protein product [Cylindrotheca closterium]